MNIILTSVGRRTYIIEYFKEALKGIGKVHASNSILTYSLQQADKYILTPNIYDKSYIGFLLSYCKKEDIHAIISLFDIDLPILSKNRELFAANGITVVVSDYNVTQICNDKWNTYAFLRRIGLKQTPSYLCLDELKKDIEQGVVNYPIILKPRWGMGSIGIYKAMNSIELDVLFNKLHQEIFSTYLKSESSLDTDNCIIMQQMIAGQEYGLEILNDLKGEYATTFAKKKIAMRAGETDVAEIIDSKPFEDIASKIATSLRHQGILDLDCFVTNDNQTIVLEMNCRFGGQYPFSHLAGANVPKQIIKWLQNKKTDPNLLKVKVGTMACKDLMPVIIQ